MDRYTNACSPGRQVAFKVLYSLRDLLVSETRKYVFNENFKIEGGRSVLEKFGG